MSEIIRLQNITKRYTQGDKTIDALAGIDFSLGKGDFVAVMGPSGCGKSTLMYTLGLLARPTSGKYILEGKDVSQLAEDELAHIRNRKIGFIFQSYNLLPKTSVLENVMLPTVYSSVAGGFDVKKRALELLEKVGMLHRLDNHPNQLSGGEQQRVAIARALINSPSLMLADEPTGNLDSKTADGVIDTIRGLSRDGNTIVMVSHEEEVAKVAQKIIRMKDGRIVS